jgi:hypothetical protein
MSDAVGQLRAASKCVCDPETFIGDYFGIDSGGGTDLHLRVDL